MVLACSRQFDDIYMYIYIYIWANAPCAMAIPAVGFFGSDKYGMNLSSDCIGAAHHFGQSKNSDSDINISYIDSLSTAQIIQIVIFKK